MKIVIIGGTGFVGRNIARALAAESHQLILIARGMDRTDTSIRSLAQFVSLGLDNTSQLAGAMAGCDVVVHFYGRGDHMLTHLSRAFYTFPVFAFVGFRDKPIRPNAVEDVVRIVKACVVEGALSRKTVAVLGPEELTLRRAVRRVASVVGRHPIMFPMPVWFHRVLGWCLERIMKVPMVSSAQAQILHEGLAELAPACELMPPDLAPQIRFTPEQIRKGLPQPGPFT